MMLNVKRLMNVSNTLNNQIRLSGIVKESIVDGPGIRYVIFTQGCKQRCIGCHNPEAQSLTAGKLYEIGDLVQEWRQNPLLKGITISGGEPFLQPEAVWQLVEQAIADQLDIVIYSGYYYEELSNSLNKFIQLILANATYLIDGPYDQTFKNLNLLFRGSSNQRFIDLKETKTQNKVVLVVETE